MRKSKEKLIAAFGDGVGWVPGRSYEADGHCVCGQKIVDHFEWNHPDGRVIVTGSTCVRNVPGLKWEYVQEVETRGEEMKKARAERKKKTFISKPIETYESPRQLLPIPSKKSYRPPQPSIRETYDPPMRPARPYRPPTPPVDQKKLDELRIRKEREIAEERKQTRQSFEHWDRAFEQLRSLSPQDASISHFNQFFDAYLESTYREKYGARIMEAIEIRESLQCILKNEHSEEEIKGFVEIAYSKLQELWS